MPSDAASHSPLPEVSASREEELDPELLALPDPPRQQRTLTLVLLAATALASLAMVYSLRRDVAYAFASSVALELGELGQVSFGPLEGNKLVRGRAMLGAAGAIRYERPFESPSYRLAPVAGHPNIWVEVQVPEGAESGRFIPPQQFVGRLVPFVKAGPKHRGLARAINGATGQVVPEGAWLLADGERPSDARWAVALVVLFALFAGWNLVTMVKLVRKVKE